MDAVIFFLEILRELHALNNFNGVMEVGTREEKKCEREERRIQNGMSWEEEKYGREDESDERDMRESL